MNIHTSLQADFSISRPRRSAIDRLPLVVSAAVAACREERQQRGVEMSCHAADQPLDGPAGREVQDKLSRLLKRTIANADQHSHVTGRARLRGQTLEVCLRYARSAPNSRQREIALIDEIWSWDIEPASAAGGSGPLARRPYQ